MKRTILTLTLGMMSLMASAQSTTTEITSIKPADGHPVVFTTTEELNAKKADKIEKIKDQIRAAEGDAEKVLYLRQELWRFENAIATDAESNR